MTLNLTCFFFFSRSHRPVAEVMDPVDQRVKPVEVELSRNLQTYLQRLGLLPKTLSAASLSPQGKVRDSWMLCMSYGSVLHFQLIKYSSPFMLILFHIF